MTVFNTPADLTAAILDTVQPRPMMVPTIAEQMTELIKPGRAVAFRTESGSLYDMSIFDNGTVTLMKVNEATDKVSIVAQRGTMAGAHDKRRDVRGVIITEPSGRNYKTSAVVKIWLAYDAVAGQSFSEPV